MPTIPLFDAETLDLQIRRSLIDRVRQARQECPPVPDGVAVEHLRYLTALESLADYASARWRGTEAAGANREKHGFSMARHSRSRENRWPAPLAFIEESGAREPAPDLEESLEMGGAA